MLYVNQLNKAYGKHQVLDNLSFQLDHGEIVALVGPNGVGKTTLFDVIMNLNKKQSGEVSVDGVPHEDLRVYEKVGYMQDNQVLFPYLTGYDHLTYIAHAQGISREQVEEVVDEVGIRDYVKRPIQEYSLGMKQHILLACAIVHRPGILLLDEPFNGLDPSNLIKIRELILSYANQGTTVFLSSHNLDEIDRMTKKIFFLKDGHIIHRHLEEEELVNYNLRLNENLQTSLLAGVEYQEINPREIVIANQDLNAAIHKLTDADYNIESIAEVRTGAEQVYQEIFMTQANNE